MIRALERGPLTKPTILLTKQARFDPGIVAKIKKQLVDGKNVVITSGLLKALQGKGIEDIVELEYTGRTVAAREFQGGRGASGGMRAESDILIPEIRYATNDSWETVSAFTSPSKTTGTPMLLSAKYSKGMFYVLTIPQAIGDLYSLPAGVLKQVRDLITRDMYVRVDAPAKVSLFVYDNDKFIVESFQEDMVQARVITEKRITKLRDLVSGQELSGTPQGDTTVFDLRLSRGSYRAFSAE